MKFFTAFKFFGKKYQNLAKLCLTDIETGANLFSG